MRVPCTTVSLRIPNNLPAIGRIQDAFLEDVERQPYDEAMSFALVTGLTEALANAFHHGNRRRSDKHIDVRYRLNASGAQLEVSDYGDGFRPEDLPDPTADENVLRPTGRGVMMMNALFDRVEFRLGGRQVRLIKNRRTDETRRIRNWCRRLAVSMMPPSLASCV